MSEHEPGPGLSDKEVEEVAERRAGAPKVVHEVIRLAGEDQLERSVIALLMSGFAAGIAVSASLLAETVLYAGLPDAPWRDLVVALGYPIGFVLVIMGGLQFFTESTVTAVLPIATHPSWRDFGRLMRLWSLVLAANLAGTFVVAALMMTQAILAPEFLAAAFEVSHHLIDPGPWKTLVLGVPAGFLVAGIAWVLPNARGQEFWVIYLVTWMIAAGGFSHVIASSGGVWLLLLNGDISLIRGLTHFILPALAGNILGGAGLFGVLAHGQVRDEIAGKAEQHFHHHHHHH